MPDSRLSLVLATGFGLVVTSACRTANGPAANVSLKSAGDVGHVKPPPPTALAGTADNWDTSGRKGCDQFQAAQGFTVTKRDAEGAAVEGTLRVLAGDPADVIYLVGDFNKWGAERTAEDRLSPVAGTPYFEGRVRALRHLMEYRLELNGLSVLDPAAPLFSNRAAAAAPLKPLNSVFWDFDHVGAYKATASTIDLRAKPAVIAEGEVYEMARKWPRGGAIGPISPALTYRFVGTSGLIEELKRAGYNAVAFLPLNASDDGDLWRNRFRVYGPFAPDARYGDPDDFKMMVDAFNKAGIAVIMSGAISQYPVNGNNADGHAAARDLAGIGAQHWRRADGKALYGDVDAVSGSKLYDAANPVIRRFLADSVTHMVCRYRFSGVRLDRSGDVSSEFFDELKTELRRYRPDMMIIAEPKAGVKAVVRKSIDGGRSDAGLPGTLFDFLNDSILLPTAGVDMERLHGALRAPLGAKDAPHVQYAMNLDDAAAQRSGSTGAYLGSLLGGSGDYYVERKTMAFASLTMLASSAYLDMPQLRLLQEGTFDANPAVDWNLKRQESQGRSWHYFADLATFVQRQAAFAAVNLDGDIENHIDTTEGRRIVSLRRVDKKTGKVILAIVNLGHVALSNYGVGVDAVGTYRVAIDGDDRQYGGTGELEKRLPLAAVDADGSPLHGKAHSLTLPFLGAYSAVVLATE